jgi:hypothetical protein
MRHVPSTRKAARSLINLHFVTRPTMSTSFGRPNHQLPASYFATWVAMALVTWSAPCPASESSMCLPSAWICLLRPCRCPPHHCGRTIGWKVLVKHCAVPVSVRINNFFTHPIFFITHASLLSGISSPHSGFGFFIISSLTFKSACSFKASIHP